jgi:multicomponent Na+:H+ antiporter subunit G
MPLTELIGLLFITIGVFFSSVGIIGNIRLPDVYSRIHASGKVATLGIFGLLFGTGFLLPGTVPKLIALALFLIITTPVASHAIAFAASRQGVPRVNAVRDDLAEKENTHSTG